MSVINVKRESYKAMNSIKGMLLVLCLGASCANAAVITQTQNIATHVPNKSGDLTFNYFDSSKGTLLSVEVVMSVTWWGGYYALDNDSDVASEGTAKWGIDFKLTDVPGVTSTQSSISDSVSDNFSLAKNDGDSTSEFNVGGEDYDRLDGPTYDNRISFDKQIDVAANKISSFEDSGAFIVPYQSLQYQSFSGLSGNSSSSSPLSAYGTVTITYTYTPVPEPATASLACAGLLMLLRRRRQA